MPDSSPQLLRISAFAARAGVGVQTIRFYEREGLLAPPPRTAAGYRLYSEADLERVRVIRVCQKIGFTLKDIKEVLEPHRVLAAPAGGAEGKSAAREAMLAAAEERLAALEKKLAELNQMRADMAALVATLSAGQIMVCPGSRATATL